MTFSEIYKQFCFGTCFISCIVNGILIYIVHKRQDRIGFYRHFTTIFVIFDVLYSIAFAIVQPYWYAGPGMLGFFSSAPWSRNVNMIKAAYQFWFISFILVLLCVSCGFIYRYGLLCSPRIVAIFENPYRCAGMLLFLLVYLILWMLNINFLVLMNDSRQVRLMMEDKFNSEYKIDFLKTYALTVDVKDEKYATYVTVGALISTALMQSQILIIVSCGWNIHRAIKAQTMSSKLKQFHQRALNMMISQALNPFLFLYIPAFMILFGMFIDTDFGDLPKVLAMTLALFPIFNPIIVIYFTDEYKRFILNNGQTSSTQMSVVMSKSFDSRKVSDRE